MRADTLTIQKLFKQDVQYVIPEFQRPYVWGEEDQWDPLWQDLTAAAERYSEHLHRLRAEDHASPEQQAEELAGRHFLGAVVLKQKPPSASQATGSSPRSARIGQPVSGAPTARTSPPIDTAA